MANTTLSRLGFHACKEALQHYFGNPVVRQTTGFTYTFENFFHPFVGELIETLNRESLPGMLDPDFHQNLAAEFFDDFYTALTSRVVEIERFPKEIELHAGGPYANYNWELLFHIPLAIAVHLSKNQRFAEAQRWFHYIFDPTSNDTSVPVPERFWKFLAFRHGADPTRIDELLALLSKPDPDADETRLRESILHGYEAVRNNPFQPHAVARTRQIAYQYCVVMKYLDNLIAWGDHLFRQDTLESLNEATQRYVLAANLLGERPERIPPRGSARPRTFAELKKQGLDPLGNALVDLEGQLPFNLSLPLPRERDNAEAAAPLFGIGRTLYFCVPHNEKLLGYWDTVADRLFKIRNCLNIEGVFRQLPLFDPPLDPGMLVKATAAGIDIRSMVNGLNQPVGPLRCLFLIQKALELAGEVRGLGSALLSAIEKGDGERMALLRQGHEIKIHQMAQEVRFLQWKGAQESTEALLRGRASALERFNFYRRLLGLKPDDEAAPEALTLDRRELTEENFDEVCAALVEKYDRQIAVQDYPKLRLPQQSSPSNQAGAAGQGNLYLNSNEDAELNEHLPEAKLYQLAAFGSRLAAPFFSLLPDWHSNLHYWGVGATIVVGGRALTENAKTAADVFDLLSSRANQDASSAAKTASYERRADDWLLQHNLAARELMQIGRQILGALIGEQVAYHEYLSIQKQIEQSQEVDRFLREKFTNAELFAWMQGEISRLYYEYYRFAFDTARKAETAMKFELMRPEVDGMSFVKFNYWDGGRKGLLSGEALYLDVKRMELAYHENNRREFELTKHVSLLQVDPLALVSLRETGRCTFRLAEELFDMDGPGHYLRHIKNVELTVPCVASPFASVNCTLTLRKSSIRTTPSTEDNYARAPEEDSRFVDYFGSVQSIVTSSGQNDSGLFEANLRDERYLPFENSGVISEWQLRLPADPSKKEPAQFDYDTISDVILHIRYTAREGGEELRKKAVGHLGTLIDDAKAAGSVRLFSLRHEFPSEWAAFKAAQPDQGFRPLKITVTSQHLPFWSQGKVRELKEAELIAAGKLEIVNGGGDTDTSNGTFGNLQRVTISNAPVPELNKKWEVKLKAEEGIEDAWLLVKWG